MVLYNLLATPGFFAISRMADGRLFGSPIDILHRGATLALVAIGMTLVIATGGIDVSVGAVMAMSGAVAAVLIARPEYSPLHGLDVHGSLPLVLAGGLVIAALAGLLNGVLVSRIKVQPIVATLILMVAGRGIAQLLTNGQIPTFENPSFEFLGRGVVLGLPFPIVLAGLALAAFAVLTRCTALGQFLEATGGNARASRLSGVSVAAVILASYVLCALCAGMAGMIQAADIRAADTNNNGLYMELDAILAVCIGGTALTGGRFTLIGSVLGALLIQTLTTTILTHGVAEPMTIMNISIINPIGTKMLAARLLCSAWIGLPAASALARPRLLTMTRCVASRTTLGSRSAACKRICWMRSFTGTAIHCWIWS